MKSRLQRGANVCAIHCIGSHAHFDCDKYQNICTKMAAGLEKTEACEKIESDRDKGELKTCQDIQNLRTLSTKKKRMMQRREKSLQL